MRLLVACPNCRRQYEAGKLKPGAKFHCSCGKVLRVKQAKGHDAAVIRCSGCGAPREKGAKACEHCSADFTLHERDMHTVCPECLTRVSDKARFCHSCGQALTASSVAGEESNLPCPACESKPHLRSRRLGTEDFSVLECQGCAGMWIESRIFEELTRKVEAKQLVDSTLLAPTTPVGGTISTREKWSYRHCPSCNGMMQRRNYARRSGVIIDVCREHGIWFDNDELQRILAWIRAGGMQKARHRAKEEEREAETRRRIAAASDTSSGSDYDGGWFTWQSNHRSGSMLIDALIDSIFMP